MSLSLNVSDSGESATQRAQAGQRAPPCLPTLAVIFRDETVIIQVLSLEHEVITPVSDNMEIAVPANPSPA
jgi:hypothetical protein